VRKAIQQATLSVGTRSMAAPAGGGSAPFSALGSQVAAACEELDLTIAADHQSLHAGSSAAFSAAASALLAPVAPVLAHLHVVGTGSGGDLAGLMGLPALPQLRAVAASYVVVAELPVLVALQVGGGVGFLGRALPCAVNASRACDLGAGKGTRPADSCSVGGRPVVCVIGARPAGHGRLPGHPQSDPLPCRPLPHGLLKGEGTGG
jgi:hypothetical protein